MREPEVEEHLREYLKENGYSVRISSGKRGPDILAEQDGRTLLVEVKGDRPGHQSSPGNIYTDTMTLLGQILFRKGQGQANEYAIGIRPVHLTLIKQTMPSLKALSIKIMLVNDSGIEELA